LREELNKKFSKIAEEHEGKVEFWKKQLAAFEARITEIKAHRECQEKLYVPSSPPSLKFNSIQVASTYLKVVTKSTPL